MFLQQASYTPSFGGLGIRAMMEAGVDGYILKDTPPRDVIESVRMVMDGRTVFSSQVSGSLVRGYLSLSTGAQGKQPDAITDRERDVLQLLVNGATNAEIANELHVSVGTVQFHLTNIYSKLGVRSRAEAIVHASREGLVVLDD